MENSCSRADRVGAKIKLIANSFQRIANSSTAEMGITASQSFLLGYLVRLKENPPCQHDIEVRFNIKHPTATGLLNRLKEKGYVTFASDSYDKRIKRVIITYAGEQAAEKTKVCLDELEEKLLSDFTPQEVAELHRLLNKLVDNAWPGHHCFDRGDEEDGDGEDSDAQSGGEDGEDDE